jgi:hypothetical protein
MFQVFPSKFPKSTQYATKIMAKIDLNFAQKASHLACIEVEADDHNRHY